MIQFQYYHADIRNNKPIGWVTLEYFISAHKNPKPKTLDVFKKIEQAAEIGDKKTKDELKQNSLYFFTPCVHIGQRRRYDNIIKFTGLAVLDFDKINNASGFRDFIFSEYNYILAAWTSPSKKGVKALVRIPTVSNFEQFKEYFWALEKEFNQYAGFDFTTQNCVLPLFQSYDFELKYRYDPDIFDKRASNPRFTPAQNSYKRYEGTDKSQQIVIKMIETGINKIVDNGHPQLRALCLSIGGYIAGGMIDEYIALSTIDQLIASNGYLRKGVSGYQKTARQMINNGKNKPLYL